MSGTQLVCPKTSIFITFNFRNEQVQIILLLYVCVIKATGSVGEKLVLCNRVL